MSILAKLISARRGNVALLSALMLIPLMLATGAAVDFARIEILKRSLQSVVDGAALAGASALSLSTGVSSSATVATDYFNKGVSALATTATVSSPTVTGDTVTVTVTATATLQYAIMSIITSGTSVTVSATAKGPAYVLQVSGSGIFTSDAADSNSIYFYTVAADGTLPTSITSMKLLFTNDPAVDPNYVADNASAKAIGIGANDNVGFALVNKTDGISDYGVNPYGAGANSVHYFYSSLAVPSSVAYPSQGQYTQQLIYYGLSLCYPVTITSTLTNFVPRQPSNPSCYYPHPCTTLSNGVVLQNNLLINNVCSTPATATKTCLQLYNHPLSFEWNDMGGRRSYGDDYNYLDANYTVTCLPAAGSSATQPNAVILTQ